jgi:hypothetical protein
VTKPTPAEAKAVWDSFDEPSARKVADKLAAAGKPISFKTIALWKREGWPGTSAEDVTKAAEKAVEMIDNVVPALTGDVTTTTADVAEAKKPAEPDNRPSAERAQDALLKAITGATAVWETIFELAKAVPTGGDAVPKDAPPMLLLTAPEGIAKLMKAASEAINSSIEGLKQIPTLRVEEAAAVPGAQTIYAPGEAAPIDEDYPLKSEMAAFDKKLAEIRGTPK